MKKYFLILCVLFSVYGEAATLDISGWNQVDGSGENVKVVITGVANNELFFASGTPGSFTSRVIATTDLPSDIPLSKLAQTAATNGQAIVWNGSAWVPTSIASSGLVEADYVGAGAYAPGYVYAGDLVGDHTVTFSPALGVGDEVSFDLNATDTRIFSFGATPAKRVGFSGAAINSITIPAGQHILTFYKDFDGVMKLVDSVSSEPEVVYGFACSDETTAITTGTSKVTFRMPHAMTLTAIRASVGTAPTGQAILIDINEAGSTILSTLLMIDATEKTSTTATTAYVISDAALADDAEITIGFTQVGSSVAGAGVKVWLIGTR